MAYEEDGDSKFVIGVDDISPNTENVSIEIEKSSAVPVFAEKPNKDSDVVVEVVDDTPPEDRNRVPLPEDEKNKALADDDLEQHSEKVKKRINILKKQYHDERRAREAAEREREEATRFAQAAYQEKLAVQERLRSGEAWAIEQAKRAAAAKLDAAKKEFIAANESGDSEKLAEAQQAMNFAAIEFNNFSNYVPQPAPQVQQVPDRTLQPVDNTVYKNREQTQAPALDPKVEEWAEKNPWFRTDKAMKGFALGVHDELIDEGVDPTSDEYFTRLDGRMRQAFPSKFATQERKPRLSTVVAPVGQNVPEKKRVVLTKSQFDLARKLGITPEQYAEQVVVLENNARRAR